MRSASLATSLTIVLTVTLIASSPTAALAQSELDASEATAFLGSWVISINSDYGPFSFDLEIADEGGKVAATITSTELAVTEEISDISRSGESLVLKYEAEAEGQIFPVQLELERDGEELSVGFDAADGQFFAMGKATRAGS